MNRVGLSGAAFIEGGEQWLDRGEDRSRFSFARPCRSRRLRSRTCSSSLPWIDNPDGRHDSISVMAIAASWRPCKERNRKKRSGGQEEEAARVSASGTWYRRGFMNGRGTALSEQGCIDVPSYLVRVSRRLASLNRYRWNCLKWFIREINFTPQLIIE